MGIDNVVNGPASVIPPIITSTGLYLHNCLLNSIKNGFVFINEITGEKVTYLDFLQNVCRLASSLRRYGVVTPNIAICSENNNEFFIPVMACLYLGIPVVPLNPIYTESEYTHALDLCHPKMVFCSKRSLDKVLNLRKKYSQIKDIIVINSEERISGTWTLKDFIDQHSNMQNIYDYKPVDVDIENHAAFIMFSSGTTGLPKGVLITHKNINTKNALMLEPVVSISSERQSKYSLGVLPFFHAFGLHAVMNGLQVGKTIVVLDKFDVELYLGCIEKYKIQSLSAAPPLMQLYAKSPLIDKFDLSHVYEIIVGAGPISESLEHAVKKRIPVKYVRQGYGMTETTLAMMFTPTDTEKAGSCGKLLPNLSCVVKDLETGRNLGPNQPGELCFKGGVIMKGYYRNAVANKETFSEDGFMRSGDIGYYDENECFYIIDRLKELIKYKAFQVAPAEVEAVLMTNPKIIDAAVIGLPDEDAGELPMAFVIKRPNMELTEVEVQEYVTKYLSPMKYLRGGVVFVSDIPRNPSGKILRRELRKMVQKLKSKL